MKDSGSGGFGAQPQRNAFYHALLALANAGNALYEDFQRFLANLEGYVLEK